MKLTINLTIENLLKNEKWTSQFDKTQLELIKTDLSMAMTYQYMLLPN